MIGLWKINERVHSFLLWDNGKTRLTSRTKMKVNTTDMVAKGTVTGSSTSHCGRDTHTHTHTHTQICICANVFPKTQALMMIVLPIVPSQRAALTGPTPAQRYPAWRRGAEWCHTSWPGSPRSLSGKTRFRTRSSGHRRTGISNDNSMFFHQSRYNSTLGGEDIILMGSRRVERRVKGVPFFRVSNQFC